MTHPVTQQELSRQINASANRFANFLLRNGFETPKVAICTGTNGSENIIAMLQKSKQISFSVLGFTEPTVEGHSGMVHVGYLSGALVCVVQGRLHYFEGVTMHAIVLPVRTLCVCGVNNFIFTNASGSMGEEYEVGDIAFIYDHVNNLGDSPLRGFPTVLKKNDGDEFKLDRFVSMQNCYDREWIKKSQEQIGRLFANTVVYTAVPGPELETDAEIERKYSPQADVIGMSMIPEVIAVRQFGAKVLGLTLITNLIGKAAKKITHQNNLSMVSDADERFSRVIDGCVRALTFVPAIA
ncbi:MAG: purine-nucleoside phosphorylase [Candidatus Pacebacteria bacterium]|jgi:purine-nucleoside phosphorylase|nr:purine-nucleoside phosphorylase [Candidatus Paceibacterota bacterium]